MYRMADEVVYVSRFAIGHNPDLFFRNNSGSEDVAPVDGRPISSAAPDKIPRMIAFRLRRPAIAPLLIAAVVFAAVLPPAHIHLAEHDDHGHDHAAVVEHSHWSAHQSSQAMLDDDDGRVIFVDRLARSVDAPTAFAQPPAVLLTLIALPPLTTFTAVERQTSGNSPRDGPARARQPLRAPPSFDTL
jgi:hypothetical protein